MAEHGKSYNDHTEYRTRFNHFVRNHMKISEHNSNNAIQYYRGHNQFSDWSEEEVTAYLTLDTTLDENDNVEFADFGYGDDNTPIDWRDHGAVTPVQDQGSCGSCWAFSATGAMEGAHFAATGELKKYSESLLVDCDYGILSNHGCSGGLMNNAFKYLKKHTEILEEDYPYEPVKNKCHEKTAEHTDTKVSAYKNVKASVSEMKKALMQQPIAIGVHAGQDAFMQYAGGIMTGCQGGSFSIDHGILLVGWGVDEETS